MVMLYTVKYTVNTVHSSMNCLHKGHSRLISLAVEEVGMGVCPAGGDRGTFPHWGHSRLIFLAVEVVINQFSSSLNFV